MNTKESADHLTGKLVELDEAFAEVANKIGAIAAVNPLAISAAARNRRIDALMKGIEENKRLWQDLQRQWQAYLNTLPKH